MRKGWWKLAAVAAGVVLALFILKKTVLRPKPVEVEIATVDRGDVEDTVINSQAGSVKVRRRAALSPEIAGTISAVHVKAGDRVEAGQVLLELDNATWSANLAAAEEALRVARSAREDACAAVTHVRRNRDRARQLFADGVLPQGGLDQAEENLRQAEAACSRARLEEARIRESAATARIQMERTTLRAPFAGVVAEVNVEVGEPSYGGGGDTMISGGGGAATATGSANAGANAGLGFSMGGSGGAIDLMDPAGIYVSAPMDETDLVKLKEGAEVRILLDPYPDRPFPGHLSRVAPYALDRERQNRTVEVEAVFDDPALAATLIPGITADVEVIRAARRGVLRVPTPALREDGTVLVLENGVLKARAVKTGLSNWRFAEVLDGLREGEQVVASLESETVKEGARARPAAAAKP